MRGLYFNSTFNSTVNAAPSVQPKVEPNTEPKVTRPADPAGQLWEPNVYESRHVNSVFGSTFDLSGKA